MDDIMIVTNQYRVSKTNTADAVLIPNVIRVSFILSTSRYTASCKNQS